MDKLYLVNFHVKKRLFNRYFSSKDKAWEFARSLWDGNDVDHSKNVYLLTIPTDTEKSFTLPAVGRDNDPDTVILKLVGDELIQLPLD